MTDLATLRRQIVTAAAHARAGHIPSAFSILEIVWALYERVMSADDILILSKGHGCLALYAVLADRGVIPAGELERMARPGAMLGGHPDAKKIPGVPFSTGSLGHGLALGCGLALSRKIRGEPGRVFVLCGDGELQEGSIWEALDVGSRLGLNVVLIVDHNQSASPIDVLEMTKKLRSFGWPAGIVDGHNPRNMEAMLTLVNGPVAWVARTVKGKGCKTFEADPEAWHHRSPGEDELAGILEEIA